MFCRKVLFSECSAIVVFVSQFRKHSLCWRTHSQNSVLLSCQLFNSEYILFVGEHILKTQRYHRVLQSIQSRAEKTLPRTHSQKSVVSLCVSQFRIYFFRGRIHFLFWRTHSPKSVLSVCSTVNSVARSEHILEMQQYRR